MENLKYSQSKKVFRWWDYPLFFILTAAFMISSFYFFQHWFSQNDWMTYPIIYSLLTIFLALILINYSGLWFLLLKMRKPEPVLPPTGLKVAVVTTFVPGAEPLVMLRETVKAMVAIEYPHDTWVLDEGDDAAVKAMCQEIGAKHFTRKHSPQYQTEEGTFKVRSKHGNYNAWLHETGFQQYDFISGFDPDHIPHPNFLLEVLGYFNDPAIGYVQVAPAYYNQKASFIARGAAEETYDFHSTLQMASYAMDYPIVIGSHNTHRVTALQEVGGFGDHDADDLLITMLYRAKEWKGVYIPKILARGLTPVDWSGYIAQQRRWARSVLDLKLRFYPKISQNLSLPSRVMGFLHGLTYLNQGIGFLAGILLLLFMLISGQTPAGISFLTVLNLAVLYGAFQLCEFYRQRFYLDWRTEWGFHGWAVVLKLSKWPFFLMAFLDVITSKRIGYVLTQKTESNSSQVRLFWPHLLVAFLIGAAWAVGVMNGYVYNPILEAIAGFIIIGHLALTLTAFKKFPPPYEKKLQKNLSYLPTTIQMERSA